MDKCIVPPRLVGNSPLHRDASLPRRFSLTFKTRFHFFFNMLQTQYVNYESYVCWKYTAATMTISLKFVLYNKAYGIATNKWGLELPICFKLWWINGLSFPSKLHTRKLHFLSQVWKGKLSMKIYIHIYIKAVPFGGR